MSLRSLCITEADRAALPGMLCCVKVLTRSLRQPKGIIKDRRWSEKNGKQIPLFGLISSSPFFSPPSSSLSLAFPPQMHCGYVASYQKAACKPSGAEQKALWCPPHTSHCLLIILQSVCIRVSRNRRECLIKPIIYNTLAAQKHQFSWCFK